MANDVGLRGFENSQDVTISNILLENFISFYDWGFLDKGGYYNVNTSTASGMYGGDKSKLVPLKDPNYTNGQVWQANRNNWVWETGVSVGTPIDISGVYINGTFRATGNLQQPYYINYPDGQVVFDSAISTSSNVKINYSSKWLNVVPAGGIPWFREIQKGSNRLENPTFLQNGSGDWAQLGQSRVQLPALAIDVIPPKELKPYQLGGGQFVENDVIFHVITSNQWSCKNIMDQIIFQNDRTIDLYDPNQMAASGVSVFNYRNELTDVARSSGMYPHLVDYFKYRECYIYDSSAHGITEISPDLYMGVVRCRTEVKPI